MTSALTLHQLPCLTHMTGSSIHSLSHHCVCTKIFTPEGSIQVKQHQHHRLITRHNVFHPRLRHRSELHRHALPILVVVIIRLLQNLRYVPSSCCFHNPVIPRFFARLQRLKPRCATSAHSTESTPQIIRTLNPNAGIILTGASEVLVHVANSALVSASSSHMETPTPSTRIIQARTGLRWLQLLHEPANAFLAKIGENVFPGLGACPGYSRFGIF